MAFNKAEKSDFPRKKGGMRRRKKVCVFCGKDNPSQTYHRQLCKTSESSYCSNQESTSRSTDALRSGLNSV